MIYYAHGYTIGEAWRKCLGKVLKYGDEMPIQHGSFSGGSTYRYELPALALEIDHPATRPLAPTSPVLIAPTNDEAIETYYRTYLVGDGSGEDYTYAQYIKPQLSGVLDKLALGFGNQACITIGDASSIELPDPPCLKVIDFKLTNGDDLNMYTYWRSWDVFAGMPENLGGLTLLLTEVADYYSYAIGSLYAFSKGAHIYSHAYEQAKEWAL